MILGENLIQEAISSGKVIISRSDGNGGSERLMLDDFSKRASGTHKISLHIGFLVKTLSHRKLDPDGIYNNMDGIVDLRKLPDNKYRLQPHESVVIFTREYVVLKDGYFGMMFPKVNLFSKGISTPMSYVDPGWKGVLELVVSNHSEDVLDLQLDQPISNLVLAQVSGSGEYKNVNQHYDYDWNSANQNARPPWTERKASSSIGVTRLVENVKRFNLTSWIVFVPVLIILSGALVSLALKFKVPLPSKHITSSLYSRLHQSFESGLLALVFRSHLVDAIAFWAVAVWIFRHSGQLISI
ncbi:MAG: hypothetical protein U1A72_01500 [Sulfuritalea sp.]|nr:hypothetical protein [Sulfuritalea sp.]